MLPTPAHFHREHEPLSEDIAQAQLKSQRVESVQVSKNKTKNTPNDEYIYIGFNILKEYFRQMCLILVLCLLELWTSALKVITWWLNKKKKGLFFANLVNYITKCTMLESTIQALGHTDPRLFIYRLIYACLGLSQSKDFTLYGSKATVGRRNLRENLERAKLGGSVRHKGIKASALFKRTSQRSG